MKRKTGRVLIAAIATLLTTGILFAEEGFEYDAKAKRDPFVPLVSGRGAYVSDAYAIGSIKDIRLEGIVWDEAKGSVVIINGEIVKEGQEIGVVKVLKIEKDGVVFYVDGEEVRVNLAGD